jgi:hypothetical protein
MYFDVIFKNSNGGEYRLSYTVYNTDIAIRWFQCLKEQVIEKDNTAKEPDRMYNFPSGEWTEERLVEELNSCISTINKNKKVIHHEAYVGMPQEQLNHLHHYFENLRGSTLLPSDFFMECDDAQKIALERYNVIIHRAENYYANAFQSKTSYYPRIVVTFNNRNRLNLQDSDYELFTLKRKFGEVYINYCEVGKPLYDVFKDGDDVVGEDNIRPLRWYSPDFTAYFHNRQEDNVNKFLEGMNNWWDQNNNYLTALGFTKGDPKNAIGNIPVAFIDTNESYTKIIKNLCNYNIIDRVEAFG